MLLDHLHFVPVCANPAGSANTYDHSQPPAGIVVPAYQDVERAQNRLVVYQVVHSTSFQLGIIVW